MAEPRAEPEILRLDHCDDPRDVVHRTVASLAQGEGVAFVHAGGVGVCVSVLHSPAVEALCRVGHDVVGSGPVTLLIRGAGEASDWIPGLNASAARLSRRAWPGPVALCVETTPTRGLLRRLPPAVWSVLGTLERVSFQVPAHPFLREVLKFLPGPVAFRETARAGDPRTESVERNVRESPCRLAIDASPENLEIGDSLVRVTPEGWQVLRTGVVDEATLARMAATIVLFVCTGNTCRSPMAEALCKIRIAERLGCRPSEVESRGFVVLSAGTAAVGGLPAAANALDVVRARGGSLVDHASRRLTPELVRQADHIVAMTGDHLDQLLDQAPEAAEKSRLLHPEGFDVADPVGADLDTYQRTADAIETYLDHLLPALGL